MKNINIKNYTCPRPRALALVAVLWAVMLLTAMVAVIAKTARLDSRITIASAEQIAGKWTCRAALETAIAMLSEDAAAGASDGVGDFWNLNPQYTELVELPGGIFNLRFIDEASKLNLNIATYEQLLWLPYMTEEIADSIIDWRDEDDDPEMYGLEGSYYLNLPHPYLIRNGSFRTVRELLLVEGVTPLLLFGEDANHNGQLDYNENDRDLRPPFDNGDGILDLGWIAYLTCYSYQDEETIGLINVNSASEQVLTCLLDGDLTLTQNIIAYRLSLPEGILDLQELLDVQGMTQNIFDNLSAGITNQSNVFTIHCSAAALRTGALFFAEAVVDRSQSPAQILFWHQGANN
jgi:type II secretory pathway component PulK